MTNDKKKLTRSEVSLILSYAVDTLVCAIGTLLQVVLWLLVSLASVALLSYLYDPIQTMQLFQEFESIHADHSLTDLLLLPISIITLIVLGFKLMLGKNPGIEFCLQTTGMNFYTPVRRLERLQNSADGHRCALARLQESVNFMIHNREIDRYGNGRGRYPAPTSALIQEQFEERLLQAGWDFKANAEYPARLFDFIDGNESTEKLIAPQYGCRFSAYLQAPPFETPDHRQLGGCASYGYSRPSVDESMRRWQEHGFDNQKRFELLDKYLIQFIGDIQNPSKTPDPLFPLHPWPSGTSRFENQETSSRGEI